MNSSRTRLLVPTAALATVAVALVPSTARAAAPTTVADLAAALCAGQGPVALDTDITDTGAQLDVGCAATLDLAGHTLSVRRVVIGGGHTFEVTDTSGMAGGLTADASGSVGDTGIDTSVATLVTSGSARVLAIGSTGASGLGGGDASQGGTVISNDTSTITATGGTGGAGIGGGIGGDGGTVTSNDTSTITATGGTGGAAVGGGSGGGAGPLTTVDDSSTLVASGGFGSTVGPGGGGPGTTTQFLSVAGTLRLVRGSLPVEGDPSAAAGVVVASSGVIERAPDSYSTITGAGSVDNGGAITVPTDAVTVAQVRDHHYLVDFDPRGGSPTPDPVTVYADTFAHGARSLPAGLARSGYQFTGWNTAPDGSGTSVGQGTVLPSTSTNGSAVPITLYAQWARSAATPTVTFNAPVVTNATSSARGPEAPAVGDTLHAALTTVYPPTASVTYQWRRSTGGGWSDPIATGADYPTTAADLGHQLQVTATGTAAGNLPGTASTATGTVVAAPADQPLTSTPAPTINGKTRVGRTLRVQPGTWDDGVTLTFQWTRNGSAIDGATTGRLTLKPRWRGDRIRVQVTGTKPGYVTATMTSSKVLVRRP